MTNKDKETVIAALEKHKGSSIGLIAATIRECQRVVQELPADGGWVPVAIGLPDEEDTRAYFKACGYYPEYQVVIKGGKCPTVLFYWGDNTWVDSSDYHYQVTHWQPYKDSNGKQEGWHCSYCKDYRFHVSTLRNKYKFCPNCGSRMVSKEGANT